MLEKQEKIAHKQGHEGEGLVNIIKVEHYISNGAQRPSG